ncbi:MAG: hypothetical protein KTR31_09695 [Myxococcales bacterium]|nr:hypothetical protein [Myxococcales bacterium]
MSACTVSPWERQVPLDCEEWLHASPVRNERPDHCVHWHTDIEIMRDRCDAAVLARIVDIDAEEGRAVIDVEETLFLAVDPSVPQHLSLELDGTQAQMRTGQHAVFHLRHSRRARSPARRSHAGFRDRWSLCRPSELAFLREQGRFCGTVGPGPAREIIAPIVFGDHVLAGLPPFGSRVVQSSEPFDLIGSPIDSDCRHPHAPRVRSDVAIADGMPWATFVEHVRRGATRGSSHPRR